MYEVKSNDLFNQIFEYYRQKRQDEDGERPWLDANFYLQMDLWVAEEFNCTPLCKKPRRNHCWCPYI